jgi:hypothetical protein
LRRWIESTLSRPEGKGRRGGYAAAAEREELLVMERHDAKTRQWHPCAFVEWHIRVDDVLTIRDAGTEGEIPNRGMVKQLLLELLQSLSPVEAFLKARVDATEWNEIVQSVSGFSVEGTEYRRPHWINIWKWLPVRAARPARGSGGVRRVR